MAWARGKLQSLLQSVEASVNPEKGSAKVVGMKELTGDVRRANNTCRTRSESIDVVLKEPWELSFLRQHIHLMKTLTVVQSMQAYLTRRKGNKTLIVYDLELTLQWQGRLAGEENDVSCQTRVPLSWPIHYTAPTSLNECLKKSVFGLLLAAGFNLTPTT